MLPRIRSGLQGRFARDRGSFLFGNAPSPGGGGETAPIPYFTLPLADLGNGAVDLTASANGSPIPTYTGASVKWAKLASGLWAQVATGVARAHYLGRDTAVGAYGGYLSEPAGIQLVTPTAAIRNMQDPSWTLGATMTALTNQVGIDGAAGVATLLTGGAVAATNTITQTLLAAAVSRCYAPFLKRATGGGPVRLTQDGFATSTDVSAQLSSVIFARPQVVQTQLNPVYGIKIDTLGDQVIADFNQLEALAATQFASSPMASAGAARAADVLNYAGAGNVVTASGTVYAELSTNYTISTGAIAVAIAGSSGSPLRVNTGDATTFISMTDGTTGVTKTGLSDLSTAVRKRSSSWGALGQQITGDGQVVASGAFDGAMGDGTTIGIGQNTVGSSPWNGTIKGVRIFPTQLTTAQLQALTA